MDEQSPIPTLIDNPPPPPLVGAAAFRESGSRRPLLGPRLFFCGGSCRPHPPLIGRGVVLSWVAALSLRALARVPCPPRLLPAPSLNPQPPSALRCRRWLGRAVAPRVMRGLMPPAPPSRGLLCPRSPACLRSCVRVGALGCVAVAVLVLRPVLRFTRAAPLAQ